MLKKKLGSPPPPPPPPPPHFRKNVAAKDKILFFQRRPEPNLRRNFGRLCKVEPDNLLDIISLPTGNLHAILSSADFFQNQLFIEINISGVPSECQIVWIQIRGDILTVLIWVQTVCNLRLSEDDKSHC